MNQRIDLHRSGSRRLKRQNGSVLVEAILIIPLLVLILLQGSEIVRAIQIQHRLHRATAALADALANQSLARDETLEQRLLSEKDSWAELLGRLLRDGVDDHDGTYRVPGENLTPPQFSVTYWDTGKKTRTSFTSGRPCMAKGALAMSDFSTQGLVTKINRSQSELVEVAVCITPISLSPVTKWIFSESNSSRFLALRRQW